MTLGRELAGHQGMMCSALYSAKASLHPETWDALVYETAGPAPSMGPDLNFGLRGVRDGETFSEMCERLVDDIPHPMWPGAAAALVGVLAFAATFPKEA